MNNFIKQEKANKKRADLLKYQLCKSKYLIVITIKKMYFAILCIDLNHLNN